jgi:hypothetical protein
MPSIHQTPISYSGNAYLNLYPSEQHHMHLSYDFANVGIYDLYTCPLVIDGQILPHSESHIKRLPFDDRKAPL